MHTFRGSALLLLTCLLVVAPIVARQELGVDSAAAIGTPKGTPLQGADLDRRTQELASLMRCPVCQGLSIADSPTLIAQAMKSEVRQLLADGYTREQIFDYFEQSYGEFVRLEPKARGFNLVVWIAPIAALLLGVALIIVRLRRPASAGGPSGQPEPTDDLESYKNRVRQELGS
ncbi:MAG: cytochrome c-type biogenesis protein CcmH [Acidobacteriota bacterium]